MTLAHFGRPDLAASEIQSFLEDTGGNGRKILLRVMRGAGTSVPREADAGSVEHLDTVIEDHVNQLEYEGGFKAFWTGEKKLDQ